MKKIIIAIVIILLLIVSGSIIYVLTNLDAIVKAAIEKYGSEATQTSVKVDRVRIKLIDGDGAIYKLTIANTSGFDYSHAVSLGEAGVGIEIDSIKEEPYVIKHITVRDPRVFFEVNKDKEINLNVIKNNLSETGSTKAGKQQKDSTVHAGAPPRLIIKKVVFEKGMINAKITPLNKDYELKLPSISMSNLGGRKGATPSQLTREILDRLIDAARAEIKKKGIDAEIDKLKTEAKKRVETEKARLKEEADSKLESEKQKAEEKLKSLIK